MLITLLLSPPLAERAGAVAAKLSRPASRNTADIRHGQQFFRLRV